MTAKMDRVLIRTQKELDRLLAKIDKREDGCWVWTASLYKSGYGYFKIRGVSVRAHQLTYAVFHGELPDGLVIDHICNNKACVNPDHLRGVTQQENMSRAPIGKRGLRQREKTHCPVGHPFEGDNLYIDKRGHRYCKACHRTANKAWAAKRKLQPARA